MGTIQATRTSTMNDPREIESVYQDPLNTVWLRTAERCGLTVVRSDTVFASFDGTRTLTICTDDHFDPDDCLAQMIFHELCHALVMGASGSEKRDWGLDNADERDAIFEHACHRLQATLADRYGLREVLGPTTDYRRYYDELPADPLAPSGDPAVELAVDGWNRARHGRWTQALDSGLRATQQIAEAIHDQIDSGSLLARYRAPHRLGLPPGGEASRCGTCAWALVEGDSDSMRCLMASRVHNAPAPDVAAEERGCRFHEERLTDQSCGTCGACCREAYHEVHVDPDEPLVKSRADLLSRRGTAFAIVRPDGRCVALKGAGSLEQPYRCEVYRQRPRQCDDFTISSSNCLEARQRTGRSGRAR
jgi:Fe-S-cluster containining protein